MPPIIMATMEYMAKHRIIITTIKAEIDGFGIPMDKITPGVKRPLFVEVPLGMFAGMEEED